MMRFWLCAAICAVLGRVAVAQSGSSVKGRVIDAATQEALAFASVAVFEGVGDQQKLLGGAQTNIDGEFVIESVPNGTFTLQISYVGYLSVSQSITVSTAGVLDLKNISATPDSKVLQEVTVTGEKSPIEITPGKRIFNVDRNLTTIGGTAESLLRNVPSVTLDETGAPSLRNMSATVYVNGKPTQLTLAQIPANQIASIEVISNPSARYDASTSGGIINIVLKKNRERGYHGLVTLGLGNNSRYDGTINLDWQKGKWNFTTLYSLNATKNPLNGYARRTTKSQDGGIESYFNQQTDISQNNLFQSGRIAADYDMNDKNTFTVAGTIVAGAFNTASNQSYAYRDINESVTGYGGRNTLPHNDYTNFGVELDWKHSFAKGRELHYTSSFTHNRVSNAGDWYTTAYDVVGADTTSQQDYPVTNRIDGRIIGNQIVAQLDYEHQVSETSKWEVGLRSFSYLRDQKYLFSKVENGEKTLLQDYSQNAQIDETVNAVYALYTKKLSSKLEAQGGLRLEQSFLHGLSRFDDTKFGYNYPSKTGQNLFQSFFPSFSITKKVDENSQWDFNLSRKVGRPNFRHMFVGIQANDKQNITIGNPKIRPEFVNTAELNYNKTMDGVSGGSLQWLATGYYIYEDHTIKPVTQPYSKDSTVLVTSFQNVKADIQYGMDNTLNYIKGNLTLLANVNVFDMVIQSQTVTTRMVRYNGKISVTYKFPGGISAQLSGQRRSRGPQLQGYQRAVNGADFALRKGFWQNRGSVTFIVNDIFNSRRFYNVYDQPLAYQVSMSRRDIRYYKITLQLPLSRATTKMKEKKVANPDIDFSN